MRFQETIQEASQAGAVSRKIVIALSITFIIVGALFGVQWAVQLKYERARADWKITTLPRLAGLTLANVGMSRELESLKYHSGAGEHREWVGDPVLLMTNGEWLVYAFRHGYNNGFVNHLFLAHGSDDRWYYSTYHFCNCMAGVIGDEPPGSIAEFAQRYSAREFDGKSDECLKKTWPLKK